VGYTNVRDYVEGRKRGSRPGCPWRAEADGPDGGVDELLVYVAP
jgi:hypothetical protein